MLPYVAYKAKHIYIYIEQLYIYTREKHVDKLFNNRKLFKQAKNYLTKGTND